MAELLTHLRKLVLVHEDMCLEMERVAERAKVEDSAFQAELSALCARTELIAVEIKRIADQVVSEETFELSMDDDVHITDSWKPAIISETEGDVMPSPFEMENGSPSESGSENIDDLLRGYLDEELKTTPKRESILYEGTPKLQQYACRNLQEVKLAGILATRARPFEELLEESKMDEKFVKTLLARFIQSGLARKRLP